MPKRTHGETSGGRSSDGRTLEYAAWLAMRQRCTPSFWAHPYYYDRGIRVCDRWMSSYEAFLYDVGRKPSAEYTLERINNGVGYEPGNVRWATRLEQSFNRSSSRVLKIGSESATISEWARRTGIDRHVIAKRLRRGITPEQAIQRGYMRAV